METVKAFNKQTKLAILGDTSASLSPFRVYPGSFLTREGRTKGRHGLPLSFARRSSCLRLSLGSLSLPFLSQVYHGASTHERTRNSFCVGAFTLVIACEIFYNWYYPALSRIVQVRHDEHVFVIRTMASSVSPCGVRKLETLLS